MKNRKNKNNVVYSTNPDYTPIEDEGQGPFPAPSEQIIRIVLEKKKRKGKPATVVKGFEGKDSTLADICRTLKKMCGVGGSAKDGELIIQGNQRDKVMKWFVENGYTNTKLSGG